MPVPEDWGSYTIAQLRQKATEEGINLGDATLKADLVAIFEDWEAAQDQPEAPTPNEEPTAEQAPSPEPPAAAEAEEPVTTTAQIEGTGGLEPHGAGTVVGVTGVARAFTDGRPRGSIIALQKALAANGLFDGNADGFAGAATRVAVEDAQAQLGQEVTGIPDRDLLEALGFDAR